MRCLSATDVAIAFAVRNGALKFEERPSRLGGTFVAICDAKGIIEVQDDIAAAQVRVESIIGQPFGFYQVAIQHHLA